MKHFHKFLLRSAIISLLITMQQSKAMETDSYSARHKAQDIQIYLLISSLKDSSTSWLPADIIKHIAYNIQIISTFLYSNTFYCDTLGNVFNTALTLNQQRFSHLGIENLLKICLTTNGKKSLLNIKSESNCTVFDMNYPSSLVYKSLLTILCSIVNRKEFVDHFKENVWLTEKTNFHRIINEPSHPSILALYLDVFLDYAQDCPVKSKEVLEMFATKDICGFTVLDIAKRNEYSTIYDMLKETKKKLKRNTKKKDNCAIQ